MSLTAAEKDHYSTKLTIKILQLTSSPWAVMLSWQHRHFLWWPANPVN